MKKFLMFVLSLYCSSIFAVLPEECPDVSLANAILALSGAKTIEIDGYIWQVEVQHKIPTTYVHSLDEDTSLLNPGSASFYWDDYNSIRELPAKDITIRVSGGKTIESDNLLSICYYDVILAGIDYPIAGFILSDPREIYADTTIDLGVNLQSTTFNVDKAFINMHTFLVSGGI